tara:strand:+ start:1852 stop:2877 length:1026 start_codon:yes stop_codon:yes gene_type:complete
MGYSPSFNGENYAEKKIYGSEITTIKLAESLVDLYDVYIFVNMELEDEIIYNGVHYLNKEKINNFKEIDIMIIVRYINYFIYFKNIAKKTFIWLHDVTVQPSYDGKILTSNGDHILYNLKDCYDKLIVLSNYHLHNNFDYINVPINKYTIIPNIQDMNYYKSNIPIIKNRFIYMSDISRGFTILLDCLIYIQKFIPDISLVVFREHEFTNDIREKICYLNNVITYGKVNQQKIADECLQAEYFFYPTNFHETFCNCAAEAQLYHTVCIYNNVGALNTTIGNRGLCIKYDLNSSNYVENTCDDVIKLMNDENKKNDFRIRGHEWAKSLDINNIKKLWCKLFE